MKTFHTFGFIGLGLIGGSIARAIRDTDPDAVITVYDINAETLSLAAKDGVADVTVPSIDRSFADCDIIFLCAPVQKNDTNLISLKGIISADCLITDVGSVKSEIHQTVREAGLEAQAHGEVVGADVGIVERAVL